MTAAHGVLLDKAAEAARQRRIFAALDMTPMQVKRSTEALSVHLGTCSGSLEHSNMMSRSDPLRHHRAGADAALGTRAAAGTHDDDRGRS